MICVFPPNATDFRGHGLGVVVPTSCVVTETLSGEWELQLSHPLDDQNKWGRLAEGNILRAPVPAASTPRVRMTIPGTDLRVVYKTTLRVNMRCGRGTSYKILTSYRGDTEMILVGAAEGSWYEVIAPDGRRGYMSASYLTYVRTEGTPATDTVIAAKQLREQPFRIYRVVPSLTEVRVYARHIFYDLMDNMITAYTPESTDTGAAVAQGVLSHCRSAHEFTMYSDLSGTAGEVSFVNMNPVDALCGESGVLEKYRGELARDWYDVYVVNRVGADSDVEIRQGKNLLGVTYDVDETNVATRLMPTGETKDGELLYLDELYVDSPHIGEYPHPKWTHLAVSDCKVGTDGLTTERAKAKLRTAAQKEFDAGCDLPDITLNVDFLNVSDTVEYAQYRPLTDIFLGDSVRVVVPKLALSVSLRMTQYEYDCLLKRYTKVTLGTAADTLEGSTISSRQIASGSIGGVKLIHGSVGTGHLQTASIGSLQVKTAAIGAAHIQDAAIQTAHMEDASVTRAKIAAALIATLNAEALTAVSARIRELVAGHITADELYAAIAAIAVAQMTTANIRTANIDWANIETLSARIAQLSLAQITTANVQTANIDWAQIDALTAQIAQLAQAQITTANIKNAAIDWAEINTLTAQIAEIASAQISTAAISQAAIDWASITSLTVAVVAIAEASIGSATIGYAQIRDLVSGTAIITEGTGGKLYIDRLAVTEANMLSLTVGELVVKGEDGKFYSVSVDANGNVISTEKPIGADNIGNSTLPAEKIIESSITARELNVASIFADSALIRAIKAANIDVADLFASSAFVGALHTNLIQSNLGASLDISSNRSVLLRATTDYVDGAVALGAAQNAGYRLVLDFSLGSYVTKIGFSTVCSAHLYRNDLDVTDAFDASMFVWTRVSDDTASDAAWNAQAAHQGTKYVTLTMADATASALLVCTFTPDMSAYPESAYVRQGDLHLTVPQEGYVAGELTINEQGELVAQTGGVYAIDGDGNLV